MSKYQLVLLLILVSVVTALVTGIVVATLVSQAPQPVTQTIQRVIEKTIGENKPLPQDDAKMLEESALARDILIEDIVARVSPAVVSVVASKDVPVIEQCYGSLLPEDDFFRQFFQDFQIPQLCQKGVERRQVSAGSGFFVSSDGMILTNKHVVEDTVAEYTVIMNNSKKVPAKVLARDPLKDIAVLKIDGEGHSFISLGDSDGVKIGQTAIAIGNALGEFQNTVSAGVISGLKRTLIASGGTSGPEELAGVMQTDAAINPGNSGGPLLNLKGEAIGLNTAIAYGAQNIGFAIPINQIKRSISSVKTSGKISYPYLGVRYMIITAEFKEKNKLAADYGAFVVKGSGGEPAVMPDSPAMKARLPDGQTGFKEGDIILEFGGVKITADNSLGKLIENRWIGDKVTLKILRDGKELNVEVMLEERK
ncbi:MAG: Peptidase S1 and S6, chymotrypsin/Hap [Parcubacteria group bacterium GW2011_GWA2_44_13]|nr:MAG: Peptidase S1 and S6, chymotrypsin/Hap [Parcubacteria group bacterium GW2011_GWA2_44_13]